ncbi:MAG TPA: porin [Planctomycetota bacterium]|nr:porin [Planctomycetota bacterium]
MTTIALAVLLALQEPAPPRPAEKAPEKPRSSADGLPVSVSWREGLRFKTDDGTFQATLGGRVLAHYRTLFDRPDAARANPDTLYLRQARVDLQGKLFQEFDFRLYLDFPTGTASATTGTLQDGYLGWSRWPELTLKIGQFKEPFSQEQTTTLRATDFVERSVLDRLAPGRDLGFLFAGKAASGLFEYEAGAFDGAGRAVVDNNDEKDLAARLRISPLEGLRLGVAGTVGDVDGASSATAFDLTTTELQIQFLDATAGTVDGLRTRIGLELTWLWESFGLRAEWARRTDTVTQGTLDEDDIHLKAWNVSVTWLLTGEKKTLEARIVPRNPFNPSAGTWGAFELAFRVARLEIDDEIFDAGVAPSAGNADRVTTFTAGVNWYLNPHVRITPNAVVEKFSDELPAGGDDRYVGALVRFQIDF